MKRKWTKRREAVAEVTIEYRLGLAMPYRTDALVTPITLATDRLGRAVQRAVAGPHEPLTVADHPLDHPEPGAVDHAVAAVTPHSIGASV